MGRSGPDNHRAAQCFSPRRGWFPLGLREEALIAIGLLPGALHREAQRFRLGARAPEGRLLFQRVFAVHVPLPNPGLLLMVIFRSSDTCSGETLS